MAHRRTPAVAAGRGALWLAALAPVGVLFACGPQVPADDPASADSSTVPAAGTEATPAAELYLPPAAEVYTPPPGEPERPALIRSATGPRSPGPPARVIIRRTVKVHRPIPFRLRTVQDPALAEGSRKVVRRGTPGVRTLVYEVTYVNGVPTRRRLLRSVITKPPVMRITAIGTGVAGQTPPGPPPTARPSSGMR